MSNKDLILGFLLGKDAPAKIIEALSTLHETPFPKKNLPEDIKEWSISIRTANCLHYADVRTLSELLSLTESELLKTPNFGRKSLNELKQYIAPLKFAAYDAEPKISLEYDREKDRYRYPREAA